MDSFRTVIITLMTASITAGAVRIFSSSGGNTEKEINLLISLSVCAVIVFSVFGELKNFDTDFPPSLPQSYSEEVRSSAENEIADRTAEILSEELTRQIESKYGVTPQKISVKLDKSDISSVKITSVTVKGDENMQDVCDYISGLLDCPVYAE